MLCVTTPTLIYLALTLSSPSLFPVSLPVAAGCRAPEVSDGHSYGEGDILPAARGTVAGGSVCDCWAEHG